MKAAVTTSSTSARNSGDVAIPINTTLSSVIFYPSPTYKKKPSILHSLDSEDEFLVNREEHEENTLPQFMCDQQDWSPCITDCIPFEEYNQEQRMLP
ncbi:hypothetical protein M0802_014583 [Mischocyttarus mexicanus]|nr:hypothetical protein M0802_014583 [Mischocyttarus mexicanus]